MQTAPLHQMGFSPAPASMTTATAAPLAVARDPLVLDASQFSRQGANQAADSTATQSAYFATLNGVDYRLKLNPPDRLTNTFHEVLSARLLNDIGLKFNPSSAWVTDGGALWVASRVIPGARDVGPFLLDAAKTLVNKGGDHPALAGHLERYAQLERQAATLANSEALAPLLRQHKKGGFDQLSADEHTALQPLRDTHRQMLREQESLLDHLPQGAALRSSLLMAAYAGEVVGEWDFLNHARFNTMVHDDGLGGLRVQTVDRGVSGLVGFGGQLKSNNSSAANQPARIDDPYATQAATDQPGAHYLLDHFARKDLAFEHTSPSFGLIGAIPRSASSAFIFRDVIRAERDNLHLGSGPGGRAARVAPAGVPEEALQVAWLLKHRAQPDQIAASIGAACTECRNHPVTRNLLTRPVMGAHDETDLARMYSDRIGGIVARAEQGGTLARWADKNPVKAQQILAAAELKGRV